VLCQSRQYRGPISMTHFSLHSGDMPTTISPSGDGCRCRSRITLHQPQAQPLVVCHTLGRALRAAHQSILIPPCLAFHLPIDPRSRMIPELPSLGIIKNYLTHYGILGSPDWEERVC
jgi:hypothetical protein